MLINNIKWHSTYAYEYDYIQVIKIFMFSDLQRWRRKNHWLIESAVDQS